MDGTTPASLGGRTPMVIDRTIQERMKAHQAVIAAQRALAPIGARILNLLADGDSWFDYPLTGEMPDPSDITVQLRAIISPQPTILNLANYGDATTQLLGVSKRNRLIAALSDNKNGKFDAILFSGGGNDLVGDQFRLWLQDAAAVGNDPTKALNAISLSDVMGIVETAYLDLIAARNSVDKTIPIFVHAYDFARPTNNGVCNVGPWLFPSLASRNWMQGTTPAEINRGAAIVKAILLEFKAMLQRLATPVNSIAFVDTQGVLAADEWANELHPNPIGFQKIADHFVQSLGRQFPGRVTRIAPANPADGTA